MGNCRKDLEFMVRDKVFLRVSPIKGVIRFSISRKLSQLFEILERIRKVAYRLALPLNFPNVQPIFHASMLRKYPPDTRDSISSYAVK